MTDSDALLHTANRAANRLAKACLAWHEWVEYHGGSIRVPTTILAEYDKALAQYREADRRAQMEASL